MGHTLAAFDLSAQFLHPRGLLEALDLAECDAHTGAGHHYRHLCVCVMSDCGRQITACSHRIVALITSDPICDVPAGPNTASASSASSLAISLTARFRDIIRKQGSVYGTEAVPLCTYSMQWLEAKGRPVSVLDIGKLAPDQLNSFLEVSHAAHSVMPCHKRYLLSITLSDGPSSFLMVHHTI